LKIMKIEVTGPIGAGKTHMLNLITTHLEANGYEVNGTKAMLQQILEDRETGGAEPCSNERYEHTLVVRRLS
jgi:nucleoside-triphosphatase THEP1